MRRFLPTALLGLSMLLLSTGLGWASGADVPDAQTLLDQMREAWSRVEDYQASVEVRSREENGSFETQKFLYTFKKPLCIRLDLESPHAGMILIYPDEAGKVLVRPSGILSFLRFHLAPDSPRIEETSGQPIDRTDLGQLIDNIGRSLTDGRLGQPTITREDGRLVIRVLARNHFRPDAATLYRFFIDGELHLPVAVEESTPEDRLLRTITFGDLRLNTGVAESLFRLDGGAATACNGGADGS